MLKTRMSEPSNPSRKRSPERRPAPPPTEYSQAPTGDVFVGDSTVSRKTTVFMTTEELEALSAQQRDHFILDTLNRELFVDPNVETYPATQLAHAVQQRFVERRERQVVHPVPARLELFGQPYALPASPLSSGGIGSVYEAEILLPAGDDGAGATGAVEASAMMQQKIEQGIGVIMKFIPIVRGEQQRTEVMREAGALAKTAQLIGVKQLQTEAGEQIDVLAMEHAKGVTLEQHNEMHRTPTPEILYTLMLTMRAYVEQLHAMYVQGIMHRDIKPANLMIQPQHPETSRIIDWGLAFPVADAQKVYKMISGTPSYLSPDAIFGDHRNRDMYALGVSFGTAIGFMQLTNRTFPLENTLKNVQCPELAAETHHTALREQFPHEPEQDFAYMLYQMVQPHADLGAYRFDTFPQWYATVLERLSAIIEKQKEVVAARKEHVEDGEEKQLRQLEKMEQRLTHSTRNPQLQALIREARLFRLRGDVFMAASILQQVHLAIDEPKKMRKKELDALMWKIHDMREQRYRERDPGTIVMDDATTSE